MDRKLKYCFNWIKSRCYNSNNQRYANYWWRGIKCHRKSFEDFKLDMYESFIKHYQEHWSRNTTIERIDTNWHYCKENCKRATWIEQRYNTSRSLKYKWIPLKKYCENNWLSYSKVTLRVRVLWWTMEEAIEWREICKNMFKPIAQYDLQWNLISEYKSISEANKKTWVWLWWISQVLNWKHKKAWWYKWKYIL